MEKETSRRKIIAALIEGRHLTLLNSREFKVAEFHTEICKIRRMITDGKLKYTLCQKRVEFKKGRYCMEYWFKKK